MEVVEPEVLDLETEIVGRKKSKEGLILKLNKLLFFLGGGIGALR